MAGTTPPHQPPNTTTPTTTPSTTTTPLTAAQTIELNRRALSTGSKVRLGLVAACAFAMIFVGANTGAMLRQDSQVSQERDRLQQSPRELVMALEARRRELVMERDGMQRKLDRFFREKAAREGQGVGKS